MTPEPYVRLSKDSKLHQTTDMPATKNSNDAAEKALKEALRKIYEEYGDLGAFFRHKSTKKDNSTEGSEKKRKIG